MKRNLLVNAKLNLSKEEMRKIVLLGSSKEYNVSKDDMENIIVDPISEVEDEEYEVIELDENDDIIGFAETFGKLVERLGFTGYRLAKESHVPQPMISRFISGDRDIMRAEFETVVKIAHALDMSAEELYQALQ